MNRVLILGLGLIGFIACQKGESDNTKENESPKTCLSISLDSVPAVVTDAFQQLHPGLTVEKWFKKESIGYVAMFMITAGDSVKTLACFDLNGTFQNEGADIQQEGEHQDNTGDGGCECDTAEEEGK